MILRYAAACLFCFLIYRCSCSN